MAAAAATDDTSRLMQLLQVLYFLFLNAVAHCKREFPCATCANVLDTPLQAIELCDEDQQLNETAFELVQKLGM